MTKKIARCLFECFPAKTGKKNPARSGRNGAAILKIIEMK